MIKKVINQKGKLDDQLIDTIEPNFVFKNKPINRFSIIENSNDSDQTNKTELLEKLKKQINSIENCNLKDNSKNLVLGSGDINSPIMMVGEAPGEKEDNTGHLFQGDMGDLLKKMMMAINIKLEKVYLTYSINFRPPEDRKPNTQEIRRYSIFLKEQN